MDVARCHKLSNPAESEKCYFSSRNRRIPVLDSIFLGGQFSHTSSVPVRKSVLGHTLLCRLKSVSDLAFDLHTSHLQLQDGAILFLAFPARKEKERRALPFRHILQCHRGQKGKKL